jgi:3-deoxy-manno-octulosonate cytidylyltransferase (CMP-KDO synthetase)
MKTLGIIPSRYASTRFPGKPLIDIKGKSMIQRVYEQAAKCTSLDHVVVATDDQRIYNHVLAFGGSVVMTESAHPSGTDRCFEALQKSEGEFDVVVNIQGDEPFIEPEQIAKVVNCFRYPDTQIATLVRALTDPKELHNPNQVKAIIDQRNRALYFSRQAIPFQKGTVPETWVTTHNYYGHVGLYGYRTETLAELTQLEPSALELAESLEQLRWLENGYTIRVEITAQAAVGIDTPEDLERLLSLL